MYSTETKINIFDIEKFAIHDGPGIRTLIFMKGCPLRCPWCANPESQSLKTQVMIQKSKCVKCLRCVEVCPNHAIQFMNNTIQIDSNRCQGCLKCVGECLNGTLKACGKLMSIGEIIKEVLKDKKYYEKSNGGITISGGEPFFQPTHLTQLVRALKQHDLHVAIETTGVANHDAFVTLINDVDLFLIDYKHIDATVFKKVTHADLNVVMKNIKYLLEYAPQKCVLRIPVIPNFNFDVVGQMLENCARMNIEKLVLLPFHNLGKNKYEELNLTYQYEDEKNMPSSLLQPYVEKAKELGIHLTIGG